MPEIKMPEYRSSYKQDRCLQACVGMVLATAGFPLTNTELNNITRYEPGLNSQFSIATLALAQYLPEQVKLYSILDFQKYAQFGEDYLRQVFDEEWLAHQRSRSSPEFEKERWAAEMLTDYDLSVHVNKLSLKLLEKLLKKNLLITSLDAKQLYGLDEISAHAVVVFGKYDDDIAFHDPDFPGDEGVGLLVGEELFANAMRTHIIAVHLPR